MDVVVITATDLRADRLGWLGEMHRSLHQNHCSFLHVVAVDRADPRLVPTEVSDCATTVVLGPNDIDAVGVGGVRNEVLMRCRAPWVTAVDDDDTLTEGSLDRRLARVSEHHHWVCGHIVDLEAEQHTPRWEQPATAGEYGPGEMLKRWPDPNGMFPYLGGAVLLRTTTALALGGWGTLRSDQDIFLHLALTNLTPGVVIDDIVIRYRKHSGQRTRAADYVSRKSARRALLRERAHLLHELVASLRTPDA